METLRFDLRKSGNPFKLLNCTNGGPIYSRRSKEMARSCYHTYMDARIPYSRNHDSALLTTFSGPYSHDISCIFRDFSADENDPTSYDFECTDEEIIKAVEIGTKTFYRLGQSIEAQVKKHFTVPPADFGKWARICEHIIRHYTEGWADGFHYDMPYWEIWNEPDLDPDTPIGKKRTWNGTDEQFYDFFETAVKHLKSCFPHLKIGGPAVAFREDWTDRFLCEMQKRNVPLDFFTWHKYTYQVESVIEKAETYRALLDKYGYTKTESILNEWNYKRNWTDLWPYSVEKIHGHKGGAYLLAVECAAQQGPIDMLMYYDTRPSVFNGVFDFYSLQPLPGYYALYYYGQFYDAEHDIAAENKPDDIYYLCGCKKDGKILCAVDYYNNDDDAPDKEITVDFGRSGKFEAFIVDDDRLNEPIDVSSGLTFKLKVNSFVFIREV